MEKRMCIGAFWRSAGSVTLWAIEKCYQCKTAYEVTTALSPDGNHQKALDILTDMFGDLVTPSQNVVEIFNPIRQRVEFVSTPRKEDTEIVRIFLEKLYTSIPLLRAHKIIGYSNVVLEVQPPNCKTIILQRRYANSFRRMNFRGGGSDIEVNIRRYWKDKHDTMPGIYCNLHPDPVLEAIERLRKMSDFFIYDQYIMKMIYWLVHGYGGIISSRKYGIDFLWVDDMDLEELCNKIRSHMGSETNGRLEDEMRSPSGWFAWEKADKSKWIVSPEERKNVPIENIENGKLLRKELLNINDDVIEELMEYVI